MELAFKILGQGRPLLLLHGLFGASDNWLGVAPKLAEHFQVFMLDLRNHGRSPHGNEMSFPALAADVAEFLDVQRLNEIFLLGHSLGGKVAMQAALQFPARVEKLVVADIAPRAYAPAHDGIFRALLALNLKNFSSRTDVENALAPEIPNLNLRRFLLKNLARNSTGAFEWKMNLRGLFENYLQLCGPVTSSRPFEKPALFIRGGNSDYISETDFPEIGRLFPQAKIETISGANHWIHADQPAAFLRLVLDFL